MRDSPNRFPLLVQMTHYAGPLIFTYVFTDDEPSGMPYLPDGDSSVFWSIVSRDGERTMWRRIAYREHQTT